MKIMDKLSTYAALVGVIGAIVELVLSERIPFVNPIVQESTSKLRAPILSPRTRLMEEVGMVCIYHI